MDQPKQPELITIVSFNYPLEVFVSRPLQQMCRLGLPASQRTAQKMDFKIKTSDKILRRFDLRYVATLADTCINALKNIRDRSLGNMSEITMGGTQVTDLLDSRSYESARENLTA